MGQPVVHFEVIGKDGEGLRSYYSELFGWEFGEPIGPTNYCVVQRDGNTDEFPRQPRSEVENLMNKKVEAAESGSSTSRR